MKLGRFVGIGGQRQARNHRGNIREIAQVELVQRFGRADVDHNRHVLQPFIAAAARFGCCGFGGGGFGGDAQPINAAVLCCDRHATGERIALVWRGRPPQARRSGAFGEDHHAHQ